MKLSWFVLNRRVLFYAQDRLMDEGKEEHLKEGRIRGFSTNQEGRFFLMIETSNGYHSVRAINVMKILPLWEWPWKVRKKVNGGSSTVNTTTT